MTIPPNAPPPIPAHEPGIYAESGTLLWIEPQPAPTNTEATSADPVGWWFTPDCPCDELPIDVDLWDWRVCPTDESAAPLLFVNGWYWLVKAEATL